MASASELQAFVDARRGFGTTVCRRIIETMIRLGFPLQTDIDLPDYDAAEFALVTDPYSQSQDLVGYWYSTGRQRIGQIQFRGDDSCYAEFDVVRPHPKKQQCFVEAINVWGKEGNIKAEAKFLDLPH